MKNILFSLLGLTIILSSCSTYSKATAALSSWNGHSKQELYMQWGAPNEVFPIDNGEILVFYGKTKYNHNIVIGTTTTSGVCKVQIYVDNSGTIYTSSFENCGMKYLIHKGRK